MHPSTFRKVYERYFQPVSFNLSTLLRWDRDSILIVGVNSPLEDGDEDGAMHKRLIKVFNHHDTRSGRAWSELGQDQQLGIVVAFG